MTNYVGKVVHFDNGTTLNVTRQYLDETGHYVLQGMATIYCDSQSQFEVINGSKT